MSGIYRPSSPDQNWLFEPGMVDGARQRTTTDVGASTTVPRPLTMTPDEYIPGASAGAGRFGVLLAGTFGLQTGDEIPLDGGAEAVQAYTESLDETERQELVESQPAVVGATDGFPAEMRFAANRILMEEALAESRQSGDAERAETLEGLLADPDRQFIFFDGEGDGRAAEVHGDLDEADHVTTIVPGINNTLDNFQGLSDSAARLQAESTLLAPPGESTVTIAWLGYDTPGILNSPYNNTAEAAAPLLDGFVNGLLLDDGVTTTLVAHSYGTVVTSSALRSGLEVDNVAVIGSPGMEVGNVDGLDLPEGTDFYAGRAPGDGVSWSENFGLDPTDPRFGAARITTGSGDDGQVRGHSNYFMAGSESLSNLAYVATDQDALVETRTPSVSEWIAVGVDEVHETVIETPVDIAQGAVTIAHDLNRTLEDQVQRFLPDPIAEGVEELQELRADTLETVNRATDFFQRVASPDLWNDIVSDVREMGVFGWVRDRAQDAGGWLIDRGQDAGGWLIDRGEDAGGWLIDRGEDAGGWMVDRGEDAVELGRDLGGAVADTSRDVARRLDPRGWF